MRYFKILDKDGKLCGFGKNDSIGIEIAEEEYNAAMKPIIEARERRQAEIKEAVELREAVLEAGFTLASKPDDLPICAGYEWKPFFNLENKTVDWTIVQNPNARGTEAHPFSWLPNMKVYANHWYKYKDTLYQCVKNGVPQDIINEYFNKI